MGFEPEEQGWKTQTNPLDYGHLLITKMVQTIVVVDGSPGLVVMGTDSFSKGH